MTILLKGFGLELAGRLLTTDVAMEAPQLICLVGPNGSGKTSLLHAIARIGVATGRVRIADIDVDAAPPALRRHLYSYLPANRELSWPLTVRDIARLGLDATDGEIEAAIARLELTAFTERRIDRLSTGERSRVLLARAFAAGARLMLLDEPIANLDPLWQLRLMEMLVDEVRTTGRGVVVALHDLDLALRYADRLIVMQNGRIAADGDPAEVVAGPCIPAVFGIEKGVEGWRPVRS